jgi:hypothetical protein
VHTIDSSHWCDESVFIPDAGLADGGRDNSTGPRDARPDRRRAFSVAKPLAQAGEEREIEEEEREFSDEVADPVLTSVFSEPRDEGLRLPLLVGRCSRLTTGASCTCGTRAQLNEIAVSRRETLNKPLNVKDIGERFQSTAACAIICSRPLASC